MTMYPSCFLPLYLALGKPSAHTNGTWETFYTILGDFLAQGSLQRQSLIASRETQCLFLLFQLDKSAQDVLSSVVGWRVEVHVYFTAMGFKSIGTQGDWNTTSPSPCDGCGRGLFYSIISISIKGGTVLLWLSARKIRHIANRKTHGSTSWLIYMVTKLY